MGKKRVYRLYSLEGLQLRMKVGGRKSIALLRGKLASATGVNQHCSRDFVHDRMLDGRKFRTSDAASQVWRQRKSQAVMPVLSLRLALSVGREGNVLYGRRQIASAPACDGAQRGPQVDGDAKNDAQPGGTAGSDD